MSNKHAEWLREQAARAGGSDMGSTLTSNRIVAAADHIESQATELDRLRALVEEAYREGFSDGEHSGDSYHHGYGAHRGDETWHDSDARGALDSPAD